jgi:hypothetical protein
MSPQFGTARESGCCIRSSGSLNPVTLSAPHKLPQLERHLFQCDIRIFNLVA